MIYTDNTIKAMKLCFDAHKEQVDKTGVPYVFHPFHLAEQMEDEDRVVVALLHDVVEDTEYTIDDLIDMGFNDRVIDAIRLLTHDKDVPYMEYVEKISGNPIARDVKLADLRHNSDLTRFGSLEQGKKKVKKYETYKNAIKFLDDSRKDTDF